MSSQNNRLRKPMFVPQGRRPKRSFTLNERRPIVADETQSTAETKSETVEELKARLALLEQANSKLQEENPQPVKAKPTVIPDWGRLDGSKAKDDEDEDDNSSKSLDKRKRYNGLTEQKRLKKADRELNIGLEDLIEDLEKKYGVRFTPWVNIVSEKNGTFRTGFKAHLKEDFDKLV